MGGASALERLLKRDRLIVGACLALVVVLAWGWLLHAASDMPAMPAAAHAPTSSMAGMSGMASVAAAPASAAWSTQLGAAFAMWCLMMTAMMLPSATPMILLYARFARQAQAQGAVLAPAAAFAGVYLLVWMAFSLVAAVVQTALVGAGAVSAMTLSIGDRRATGVLLIAVGLYQLTPLKRACLTTCRSPLSFLTRYWRPGWIGALRLGVAHGAYCVGCCWVLMALLFVGGVMNLAWVALLALIVLVEKASPGGRVAGLVAGALALAVGAVMVLAPGWRPA